MNLSFVNGEELWNYTTLACCGYAFDKQGSCVLHLPTDLYPSAFKEA